MRIRTLVILLAAAAAAIGFLFWREQYFKSARFGEVESYLGQVFKKHGLAPESAVSHYSVKRRSGGTAYYHTQAEYEAPNGFLWKEFLGDVNLALKKTPFRVTSSDKVSRRMREVYTAAIGGEKYSVMDLKITKRVAVPALPPVSPKRDRPKVAIVIDDFGYNMNNVEDFLGIKEPLTLSILPQQPHSKHIAELARSRGYEVILHLPLESWRSDVKEERNTIHAGMSYEDISARIAKELADVPGADGVSNHMGSKATEDRKLMASVLRYLKQRGLYYFDSLTSPRSVCGEAAAEAGLRCARRDRFLDNSNAIESIEEELVGLRDMALKRGRAIAVCHDRKNTAMALARMMPEMSRDGIEFVLLSELVK